MALSDGPVGTDSFRRTTPQEAAMPDGHVSVTRHSVCPLDCPDTCSLAVTVQDDRVVTVRGSDANPLTEGVVCNKVARHYPDFVHGASRLRHPQTGRAACRERVCPYV